MTHPTPTIDLVRSASQRLVRTIDSLDADDWARPSLLPDWSVSHVVAHLALNAEALAGVLNGLGAGETVNMYTSVEARDLDIDTLAAAPPAEVRDRLFASVTTLGQALAAFPAQLAGTIVERTPGSDRRFPAGAVASMRLREVEIHHADLHAGYGPDQWPEEFTRILLDHLASTYTGPPAVMEATDLGQSWELAGPGVRVHGLGHELAWWGTGRPPYPGTAGPSCDDGPLPTTRSM